MRPDSAEPGQSISLARAMCEQRLSNLRLSQVSPANRCIPGRRMAPHLVDVAQIRLKLGRVRSERVQIKPLPGEVLSCFQIMWPNLGAPRRKSPVDVMSTGLCAAFAKCCLRLAKLGPKLPQFNQSGAMPADAARYALRGGTSTTPELYGSPA